MPKHKQASLEGASLTEYEAQRQRRIERNKDMLQSLGLETLNRNLMPLPAAHTKQPVEEVQPSRASRRIAGATPMTNQELRKQREAADREEGRGTLGTTCRGRPRQTLTLSDTAIVAPFTIRSIGTTVWELGEIQREEYWSSPGCLFHHAYPVGYRATKFFFGRTFEMRIATGPQGPVFQVVDEASGRLFEGASPTKPWTDVCLAQRTGQRISGPLFFGFSDLVTQRAIASLYNPAELTAALQGSRSVSTKPTAVEAAAAQFASLEGVGEATAMALAATKALGGEQHRGITALRAWAARGNNAALLREWLLTSPELSEAVRRWPAWRARIVPSILRQLCPCPDDSRADCPAGGASTASLEGAQPGTSEPRTDSTELGSRPACRPTTAHNSPTTGASRVAAIKVSKRKKENVAEEAPPGCRSGRERRTNPRYRDSVS